MVYLGLDGERVTAEPGHILYNPATGKIAHSRHVTTSSDDLVQRALDASRVPETLPSLSSGGEAPVTVAALAPSTNTLKDPENRRAMLAGPHRAEFLAGEAEEIANLSAMGAYTFVNPEDIPEGTQILGGRYLAAEYRHRRVQCATHATTTAHRWTPNMRRCSAACWAACCTLRSRRARISRSQSIERHAARTILGNPIGTRCYVCSTTCQEPSQKDYATQHQPSGSPRTSS